MKITPITLSSDQSLYEQVADRLQKPILEGTLKPGDRLPSIRKLREQLSVSTSTVLEAYRLLEDRGFIVPRPQSGYYVKQTALNLPREPSETSPPQEASPIDISLAFQVMERIRDSDTIQLGAAIPAIEHLPLAKLNRLMSKMLRENSVLAHSYGSALGCLSLRSELAKRMLDAGCSVHPDRITITNGAMEAIYLALQAITQPGDTIAIESPTYFGILEAMKTLQLNALALPTHPREGISLSHLKESLQKRQIKACLIIANFNNPIGSCMDDAKKKQLVELLNEYDIPLIEDDVYGEIYFSGSRPKAIKAFDTEHRIIYCSSVSKILSPGLRIGWCAGGRYGDRIARVKAIINQSTSIPPQLAVAEFLANGGCDRHLRQLRHAYQSQMNRILQAICDYFPTETRVTQPNGGHVLWLEMPAGFDSLQLYHQALAHKISIAPGVMFSVSGKYYQNCFRLNTAIAWSPAIDRAMQTLGQLAKQQLEITMLSRSPSASICGIVPNSFTLGFREKFPNTIVGKWQDRLEIAEKSLRIS
ncbi:MULTISPECIES: PLP-dependent aminotransferase family protein [Spirulina sp. CCY15215]|uniref:aminotransferase-like domain-containing protein n=1 Tax=Spirulina sp. CCY15215 TaxID=2767591 RepID=UPI001950B1A3|nr:PLP-dependent aminotransferase family protein [Spirulina major]